MTDDVRTARTFWAIQLSPDLDICRALLRGDPVTENEIRPEALARAQAISLIKLDGHVIDLFKGSVTAIPLGKDRP